MESIKNNLNKIYLGVAAAAVLIAVVLCVDYGVSRKAEKSESAQTATTIAEKEKKEGQGLYFCEYGNNPGWSCKYGNPGDAGVLFHAG